MHWASIVLKFTATGRVLHPRQLSSTDVAILNSTGMR